MTGQSQTRSNELVATRALRGGLSSVVDLSNVIPFTRARRAGGESHAPPVAINPADRPAPLMPSSGSWLRGLLLLISLIAHSGLFYLFWQEPQPLPGIGTEDITVEIEIGDGRQAGTAPTPGPDQIDVLQVNQVKQNEKVTEDEKATEEHEVKPEEKRTEVAREEPVERPMDQKPEDRQQIAMVETPQAAEIPTVLPRETPPDMQAVIAPPRDQPREVQPVQATQQAVEPSEAQQAASGAGIVISVQAMATYNGRVSDHLTRHQQYPQAARSKITGKGEVAFAIDGGGRVISADVRVSSGSPILDQEMIAMVMRASPFPAPPDGQPKNFNAPVSFNFTLQR